MTWCLLQTTLLKWFSIWFVLHPNAILLLDNGMLTYSWIGWLKQYIVKNVSWYPEIINTNDKRNKKGRVILTKCTTTLTATKKMRKRKGKEGSFYSYLVCKRPYCISWTLEFSDTVFWMLELICFYFLCNELGLVKSLNGRINLRWRLRSRLMLPLLWNWSWSGLWTPEVFKGVINNSGNFIQQSSTMFIAVMGATTSLWFQLRYIPHHISQVLTGFMLLYFT